MHAFVRRLDFHACDVKGRKRGSPADVQKRALAREHKKRQLAFPTLNTEETKVIRLKDVLGEKWNKEVTVAASEKGKHSHKSLKELHSQLSAAKEAGNTDLVRELNFAIRAKTNWGKVNK